jgi:hypothetical protein
MISCSCIKFIHEDNREKHAYVTVSGFNNNPFKILILKGLLLKVALKPQLSNFLMEDYQRIQAFISYNCNP